jgi:hypothetical protein
MLTQHFTYLAEFQHEWLYNDKLIRDDELLPKINKAFLSNKS